MDRVVVIGNSGSGKTTVARRIADILGLPRLELDSVYHKEGWDSAPEDEFRAFVGDFAGQPGWVVDGNYTSLGSADLVWPLVDTVVWLDPPRRVAMYQVMKRTLRRVITRELLWGEVREPWTNLYSLDPYKNIMVWTWTRHGEVRTKYEAALGDGSWDHAEVHRLRNRREVDRLIASIEAAHN